MISNRKALRIALSIWLVVSVLASIAFFGERRMLIPAACYFLETTTEKAYVPSDFYSYEYSAQDPEKQLNSLKIEYADRKADIRTKRMPDESGWITVRYCNRYPEIVAQNQNQPLYLDGTKTNLFRGIGYQQFSFQLVV